MAPASIASSDAAASDGGPSKVPGRAVPTGGHAGNSEDLGGVGLEGGAEGAAEGSAGLQQRGGDHRLLVGHQHVVDGLGQRSEQVVTGTGQSSADDDQRRVDGQRDDGDLGRDLGAELADLGSGPLVAVPRPGEHLLPRPRKPLQPAAPGGLGPAHPPQASQLAGQPVPALEDRAVHDQCRRDPVTDLQEDQVVVAAGAGFDLGAGLRLGAACGRGPEPLLGQGGQLDVVLDQHRAVPGRREPARGVDADPVRHREALGDPAVAVENSGYAEPGCAQVGEIRPGGTDRLPYGASDDP